MNIAYKEYKNLEGRLEYLLIGLETIDDFDFVVRRLRDLQLEANEEIDGIWWKKAKYALASGERFELIFHEDAGVYAYTLSQSSEANAKLRQIIESFVASLG